MISLLFLALSSLFIQSHIVSSQDTPYEIRFTSPAPGGNAITLQCSGTHGTQVAGASFYRNGQNITNSSCLTAYPTSGSSELRVQLQSQECDGFFSCGLDGILSIPAAFYACPIRNNSDRTISAQEGDSVFLTCDFPLSPINPYHTTWIKNRGRSDQTTLQNTSDLQGYNVTENNPQHTEYVCQIKPENPCHNGSPSFTGPFINIRFIERFAVPKITQDLNYTMDNNGEGVFSVTSCGTNLTHKWYKDGGLVNSTGDSILEISDTSLRVKEVNGSLRIAYVVSNVDYDNTPHSMRQTFGVYSRTIIQNFTETTASENSMSIINVAIPMGIVILILFVICIGLCIWIFCLKHKDKNGSKPQDDFSRQTSDQSGHSQNPLAQEGECRHDSNPDCNKCQYEESMKPKERLLLYSSRLVTGCEKNKDFLKLLRMMLVNAQNERTFDKKCDRFLSRMITDIKRLMETAESQSKDGGSSRVNCDEGDDVYKQYEELLEIVASLK